MDNLAAPAFLSAALAFGAADVSAAEDPAIYPGAQCAAFWYGFSDFTQLTPFMTVNPRDVAQAETFREIALRLAPDRRSEIEQTIAEQRPQMALLAEAMIYGDDTQSMEIFQNLAETCERFAAENADKTEQE